MGKKQRTVVVLTLILTILVIIMSIIAIVVEDGGVSYSATSLRGEKVDIYGGSGMYRFDTVEKALMMRAYDWFYLFFGIPLLIIGLLLYLKRSASGYFLLLSSFSFFFYNYLISSIAISYNSFFLSYMAVFVISAFSAFYLIKDLSQEYFQLHLLPRLPRIVISIFVIFLASYFIITWLIIDITALISGTVHPGLAIYTTADMNVTDLSIYATISITSGILTLKRKMVGTVVSIGIILMAFQTLTALSVFSFLKMDYYHQDLSKMEFPILIFAIVCLAVGIVILRKVKGIQYRMNISS